MYWKGLNGKVSKFLCKIYKMTKTCTAIWGPHIPSVLRFMVPRGWPWQMTVWILKPACSLMLEGRAKHSSSLSISPCPDWLSQMKPHPSNSEKNQSPGHWGEGPRPAEARLKLKTPLLLPSSLASKASSPHPLPQIWVPKWVSNLKQPSVPALPQSNSFQQLSWKWELGVPLNGTILGSVCLRSPAPSKNK